jgi:hypothetical protein
VSFPLALPFPLGGDGVAVDADGAVYIDAITTPGKTVQGACLWMSFDGGEDWEPAILAGAFDGRYTGVSKATPLTNGIRYRTWRRSGWPSGVLEHELRFAERDTTPTTGQAGPAFSAVSPTADIVQPDGSIVVRFTAGAYALVETSMAIWAALDPPAPNGARRWEAVVKAGELLYDYAVAGSQKAANGSGGWDFTLFRPGAWAGSTLVLEAMAWDVHGMILGEVAA